MEINNIKFETSRSKSIKLVPMLTDYENPDSIGAIDVDVLERVPQFAVILSNPYTIMDRWFSPRILSMRCRTVMSPTNLPLIDNNSTVGKFCKELRVPFMGYALNSEESDRYVVIDNCVFLNVTSDYKKSTPKLLLMYVPKNVASINFTHVDGIIGVCTNTVEWDHLTSIRIPGKFYGHFKKMFAKRCKIENNIISYTAVKSTGEKLTTWWKRCLEATSDCDEEGMPYEA